MINDFNDENSFSLDLKLTGGKIKENEFNFA